MNCVTITVVAIVVVQGVYTAKCATPYDFENKMLNQPRPIFYNLTQLINAVLKQNSSESYTQLHDAVQFSPHVLYETDVLLDNIEEVVPVLNLLQRFKTRANMNPQVMLTLRCVDSSGQFLASRMSDVFYNLNKKPSAELRSQILNFVPTIALDFITQSMDASIFGSGQEYFIDFSVTKSVRDFFQFQLDRSDIAVGVIYQPRLRDYSEFYTIGSNFIASQANSANFTITPIEFDFKYEFPMSYTEFNSSLRRKQRDSGNAVMLFIIQNSDLPNLEAYADNYYPWKLWRLSGIYSPWYPIGKALNAISTSNLTGIAQVHRLYSKSSQVLTKLILMFAKLEKKDVVISNPWQNFTQEIERRISDIDRDVLTQPSIQFPNVDVDICKLCETLNSLRVRFTSMGTDEKTWRNILRHQNELFRDNGRCINSQQFPNSDFPLSVSIYFTNGVSTVWETVEPFMENLIQPNVDTGNLSLQTLVFVDEDIKASEQLQNFILNAKKQYAIGCSVSFGRMLYNFNEKSSHNPPYDFFKTTLESTMCSPIFQSVDTYVWRIDVLDYQSNKGLFQMYHGISVIKEIFLQAFPGKQVIIEFQSDKRIVTEIYNLTVSFPWNQISDY